MTYPVMFEAWWQQNRLLFTGEIKRRTLSQHPNGSSAAELEETLKNEVATLFCNFPKIKTYQQNISMPMVTAYNVPFGASRLATQLEKRNERLSSRKIPPIHDQNDLFEAEGIPTLFEPNTLILNQSSLNLDYMFSELYRDAADCSAAEVSLAMLKTYMMLANIADENKINSGAALAMVFVGEDGFYVLNVGNVSVFLTKFNDLQPDNDITILISKALDPETSAMGCWDKNGIPKSNVSILPSIIRIPFVQMDGALLTPQNCHVTACTHGITNVFTAKDITEYARHSRRLNMHNLSLALVTDAHENAEADVTVVDVTIVPGQLGCVADGNNYEDYKQKRENQAIEIIRFNLDPLFSENIKQIKNFTAAMRQKETNVLAPVKKAKGRPPLPSEKKKTQFYTYERKPGENRGRPKKHNTHTAASAKHANNVRKQSGDGSDSSNSINNANKTSTRSKSKK